MQSCIQKMLERGYTSVAKLIGFRSALDPAPGEKESLRFVFKVFDMPLNKLKYCTGSFVPPRLSFFIPFWGGIRQPVPPLVPAPLNKGPLLRSTKYSCLVVLYE